MEVKENLNRKYAAADRLARRRRRKIKIAGLLSCITVLVIGVLLLLSCTVFFPIKQIKVSGNTIYNYETVTAMADVEIGDKLFGVSQKRVNTKLTTELPYIKSVELKRISFNTLEIVVTETGDEYCYYQNGKYYTADKDNKILSSFVSKPQGITEITVGSIPAIYIGYTLDIGAENFDLVNEICGTLKNAKLTVNALDITSHSEISALVEDRLEVNFGTMQNIEPKVEHLKSMVPIITANYGEEVCGKIDLSVWTSENRQIPFVRTEKNEKN